MVREKYIRKADRHQSSDLPPSETDHMCAYKQKKHKICIALSYPSVPLLKYIHKNKMLGLGTVA